MAQTINRYDLRNTTVEKIDSCIKTLQEAIKDERSGVYGTPDQGKIKKWNDAIQTYKETKETTLAIHKAIEKNGYLNLLNGSKNAQSIAKMENALIQKGIRIEELDGLEKSKIRSQLIRDEDFEFDVGNDFGGDDGLLTKAGKKAGKDILHGDNGKGFATGLCKTLCVISIAGFAGSGIDKIFGANTVADMVGTALPNAFTFLGNAINALWTFNPLATVCLGTMVAIKAIPAIARFCNKAKMKIKGLTRSSDLAAKLRANVDYEGLANDYSKAENTNEASENTETKEQSEKSENSQTSTGSEKTENTQTSTGSAKTENTQTSTGSAKTENTQTSTGSAKTENTQTSTGSAKTENTQTSTGSAKTEQTQDDRAKEIEEIMKTFPAEMSEQEKEDIKQLVSQILGKIDDLKFQSSGVKDIIERNIDGEIYYSGMTEDKQIMSKDEIGKDWDWRKGIFNSAKEEFENAKTEIEQNLQNLVEHANITGELGDNIAKAVRMFANDVKKKHGEQVADFETVKKEFFDFERSMYKTFRSAIEKEMQQNRSNESPANDETPAPANDETPAPANGEAPAPANGETPKTEDKELENKVKGHELYLNNSSERVKNARTIGEVEKEVNDLNDKRFEILMDSLNLQNIQKTSNPHLMITLVMSADDIKSKLSTIANSNSLSPEDKAKYDELSQRLDNIQLFARKFKELLLKNEPIDKILDEAKKDKEAHDFARANAGKNKDNELVDEIVDEIISETKDDALEEEVVSKMSPAARTFVSDFLKIEGTQNLVKLNKNKKVNKGKTAEYKQQLQQKIEKIQKGQLGGLESPEDKAFGEEFLSLLVMQIEDVGNNNNKSRMQINENINVKEASRTALEAMNIDPKQLEELGLGPNK